MITNLLLGDIGFTESEKICKNLFTKSLEYESWQLIYFQGWIFLNKGLDLDYMAYAYPDEDVWMDSLEKMQKIPTSNLTEDDFIKIMNKITQTFVDLEMSIDLIFASNTNLGNYN